MEVLHFPRQGRPPPEEAGVGAWNSSPPSRLPGHIWALHHSSDARQALPPPSPPVTEALAPGEGLPSAAPGLCPPWCAGTHTKSTLQGLALPPPRRVEAAGTP